MITSCSFDSHDSFSYCYSSHVSNWYHCEDENYYTKSKLLRLIPNNLKSRVNSSRDLFFSEINQKSFFRFVPAFLISTYKNMITWTTSSCTNDAFIEIKLSLVELSISWKINLWKIIFTSSLHRICIQKELGDSLKIHQASSEVF